MTYEEFNAFCQSLLAATHVVQWGGADVWKVGGKVFAIGGWDDSEPSFVFKAGDVSFEILRDQPGLSDGDLRDYIRRSHTIVARGLSKKNRIELDLNDLH